MKKKIILDKRAEKELKKLPSSVKAKFVAYFDILVRDGRLVEPYGKRLNKDLFEIRVKYRGQYRALYAYVQKDSILILFVFQKKSQKTPLKEIKTAYYRLKIYIERRKR